MSNIRIDEVDEPIKSGKSIEVGKSHGVKAGFHITCKGVLKAGLNVFAGVCTWKKLKNSEKTITCAKLEGGAGVYSKRYVSSPSSSYSVTIGSGGNEAGSGGGRK